MSLRYLIHRGHSYYALLCCVASSEQHATSKKCHASDHLIHEYTSEYSTAYYHSILLNVAFSTLGVGPYPNYLSVSSFVSPSSDRYFANFPFLILKRSISSALLRTIKYAYRVQPRHTSITPGDVRAFYTLPHEHPSSLTAVQNVCYHVWIFGIRRSASKMPANGYDR